MTTVDSSLLRVLRDVTIFGGVSERHLRWIADQCTFVTRTTGDVIIREKEPGTDIFIMLRGRVKIVLDLDKDPFEVVEFGPGSCLGEVSVIGILNHSASAVATEDCDLMVLSKRVLLEVVRRDKELFSLLILNIARELARRLHYTDAILLHYGKLKQGGRRHQPA